MLIGGSVCLASCWQHGADIAVWRVHPDQLAAIILSTFVYKILFWSKRSPCTTLFIKMKDNWLKILSFNGKKGSFSGKKDNKGCIDSPVVVWNIRYDYSMVRVDIWSLFCRLVCQSISAHVDGGMSRGTCIHGPPSVWTEILVLIIPNNWWIPDIPLHLKISLGVRGGQANPKCQAGVNLKARGPPWQKDSLIQLSLFENSEYTVPYLLEQRSIISMLGSGFINKIIS